MLSDILLPGSKQRFCNSVRQASVFIYVLGFLLLYPHSMVGQLFSVDINGTVRSDVTAPGFSPWYMAPQVGSGKSSASQSFTSYSYTYDPDTGLPTATNVDAVINCTVQMMVPASADSTHYLNADYANKNGNSTSSDPNSGWRLSEDGCWPNDESGSVEHPYLNGGSLRLTITGLPAGIHSITTYHNDIWGSTASWHGNNVMSKCIVSANGVPVYTNTPTVVSTNDTKCGFAFVYITNSVDGQSVVLDFTPDHSSSLDFTILNGFEIDRPFAPGMTAAAVYPSPGYEHADAHNDVPLPGTANSGYLTLLWQPAGFAISNYLYFGTNPVAVANATTASPEYKGASAAVFGTTNSYGVTNLNSLATYYWRVDQLDVVDGVTNLIKGFVWQFRTRHLAFPGAEGYGRFSRGGRGGRVIEVTNLNNSGPGSYRAALEATGPRTIVFKVSGVIWLNSDCVINTASGYVTIAGQTAPGEGICIANYRGGCSSPTDVIMRFMHFRVGDHAQKSMDAMSTASARYSIFDHITSSWWLDVGVNALQTSKVGSEGSMVSYQHNILSEGLDHSYHYNDQLRASTGCTDCYGAHSLTASVGGEIGSYHHNLVSNTRGRNWDMTGSLDQSAHYAGSVDLRNNVIYNWDGRTSDGGVARMNFVNNFYRSFPTDPGAKTLWTVDAPNPAWGTQLTYMVGNVMTGVNADGGHNPALYYTNNWANGGCGNNDTTMALNRVDTELFPPFVDTQSASNAYKLVLSDSGCNLPQQDLIDRRVIGEVLDRTTHYIGTNGPTYTILGIPQQGSANNPGFIDSQTDVKDYQNTNSSLPNYSANWPWPPYNTYNVPVDTDHDGLPDWWERIKGLNTNSPANDFSDANVDLLNDGYTELDRYLNWMALPHYDCTNSMMLNVDLTQYTRGFTNTSLGATYTVFNAVGGTVTLSGRTAQFTPNTGIDSLGSFTYKVSDNTGFSYTNYINVHIFGDGSVTNAPDAPTGLNATAGDIQVSLSWTAVTGATSYHVWRSTVSGSGYVNIASSPSSSFTDTGLVNGTTYYYVVSALNSLGESTNSVEASATPFLPVPVVPTGLTATAGVGQVTLGWNTSSGATGYVLKSATVNGGPYTSIYTNATPGYTNTGLVNGTTYYYVVTAINAAGESANSTQASATPQIIAPTGLTATASSGQVALSWNASAGAASYIVKRSTTSGSGYVNIVTNATTTFTNTGLVNGTTYYFVVSALNGASESTNSSQVSATPISGAAIVVVDAPSAVVTGSSATTATTPVKVTAGANCLVVLINNMKEIAAGAWNVTWNGQTLLNAVVLQSGSTGAKSCIYYLYNPTTDGANHNLAVTFTSGATGYHIQYFTLSGVDTTVAPLTNSANVSSTTETFTISGCPPNGLAALNAVNSSSGTTTTAITAYGSGILTAQNLTGSSPSCSIGYANYIAAGTDTFTATASSSGKFAFTAAVFTPAGAAAGNTAPSLTAVSNRTINVGVNLSITNNATDSDTPTQTLTYSLPVKPTGATVTANGILNWRPLVTQANSTNPFSVVVTDNGSPSLSATQNFSVVVNPLTIPTITSPALTSGQLGFTVSGQIGPDYAVQSSTNLTDWSTLLITNPAAMPFNWSTNAGTDPQQFYRIKVGPPLP